MFNLVLISYMYTYPKYPKSKYFSFGENSRQFNYYNLDILNALVIKYFWVFSIKFNYFLFPCRYLLNLMNSLN